MKIERELKVFYLGFFVELLHVTRQKEGQPPSYPPFSSLPPRDTLEARAHEREQSGERFFLFWLAFFLKGSRVFVFLNFVESAGGKMEITAKGMCVRGFQCCIFFVIGTMLRCWGGGEKLKRDRKKRRAGGTFFLKSTRRG